MCKTTSRILVSLAGLLLAGFALRGLRSRHLWRPVEWRWVCAACRPRGCPAGC